jgi:orotate phosphoribosyltransferase
MTANHPILLTNTRLGDNVVHFGKKLTSKPFETVLFKAWKKTKKSQGRSLFILERIEWVSIAELVMLIMWISSIVKEGRKVAVCLPYCGIISGVGDDENKVQRRMAVCSFLDRWYFIRLLQELGVRIYGEDQLYFSWTEMDDPFRCKVLPLTYFTKSGTRNISELNIDTIVNHILNENSCLDPIESKAFSDVIFQEIAKNIFDHAHDKHDTPGIISIGMIKSNYWSKDEYGKWDSDYFRKLGKKSYLQIVIGDHGQGIYDTLVRAYKEDDHLNKQRYYKGGVRVDDEPHVIRYSFEKLSTRHTKQTRLMFSDIPRGLSWVYDIVREYRGLLTVRSGSTRFGMNFLPGYIKNPKFETDLADFGGSVLQIILPEYKRENIIAFQLASEPLPKSDKNVHLFSIANFWTGKYDTQESYANLLDSIDKTVRPLDENDLLFVDFSGINWEKNTLSELIRRIIYLQGDVLIICININMMHFKLLTEVDRIFLSIDGPIKDADMRITPFIDITGSIYFIGCRNEMEKNILHELFEVNSIDINTLASSYDLMMASKFIRRNRHIIARNANQIEMLASLTSIPQYLDLAIKDDIQNIIDSPPAGVTIKHKGLFHLPSGKYAETFFQLGHLFHFRNWVEKCVRLLLLKLHLMERGVSVNFIFGCTASASPLIDRLAKELSLEKDDNTLCIDNYLDSVDHPDIEYIPDHSKVLLVTDVISTGGLVERMVKAVHKRQSISVAVISIIDTREHFQSKILVDGESVSVCALFHEFVPKIDRPLKAMNKGQQILPGMEEIKVTEVHPISASPCYEKLQTPPVVIKSNEFFEKYVVDTFAVINRHIVTGGTHFCYYVDTNNIFKNQKVFSSILQRALLWPVSKRFLKSDKGYTVLYPSGSNASFATQLFLIKIKEVLNLNEVEIRSVFRSHSKSGWRFGPPDTNYISAIQDRMVIIWDDGSNSGDTLFQLVDYASSFSPKKIIVYILISRLEPFHRKFAQQIRTYGAHGRGCPVKIVFITSLDIPTYRANNCPCCARLQEIEYELSGPASCLESVNDHLKYEQVRLKPVRIKNIRKEIRGREFRSLSELSGDSEHFRKSLNKLIYIRELIAKQQSLISTEEDRLVFRKHISIEENLKMLARSIRDEPDIWERIVNHMSDVASEIFKLCEETLVGKHGAPEAFDLIAIEILFRNQKVKIFDKNLKDIVLRLQKNEGAINSFIYHVVMFLEAEARLDLLEKCRTICETNRDETSIVEGHARIKIGKAIQWARLDRAKKAGSISSLKKALVSLYDIYKEDPHKSGLQWWNTLMGTSVGTKIDIWAERYSWWKVELSPIVENFVKDVQTLQPILSVTPSIDPYLLDSSNPNLETDLNDLDEKLHILCMSNVDDIVRKSTYEEFRLIVKRLYEIVISEDSSLAKIVKGFPTSLNESIESVLKLHGSVVEDAGVVFNVNYPNLDYRVIFNQALFYSVFREIVVNICKYSKHGRSDRKVEISIIDKSKFVELSFLHQGSVVSERSPGMGESMIAEALNAYGGIFQPAKEIETDKILTKLCFQKW